MDEQTPSKTKNIDNAEPGRRKYVAPAQLLTVVAFFLPIIFVHLSGLQGGPGPDGGFAGMGGAFVTLAYWIFAMPWVFAANMISAEFPVRSWVIAVLRVTVVTAVTATSGWFIIVAIMWHA